MTRRYHNVNEAPFYTRMANTTQADMTRRKPAKPAMAVDDTDNEFDRMVPPAPAQQLPLDGVGPAHLSTAQRALQFITGGNATFTLRSKATGARYTYKVRRAKDNPAYANNGVVYFVSLLSGPDNTGDYVYIGMIKHNVFQLTRKSHMNNDSIPVKALAWSLRRLVGGILPAELEIWHAGKCGRCGRTLTVPESVASGFGPECAGKLGM